MHLEREPILFQGKFSSMSEFLFFTTSDQKPLSLLVFLVFCLAVSQIFFTCNRCIFLGKKILKPIFTDLIYFVSEISLYSCFSLLHLSCWILLRRPIFQMTKVVVKNITVNFLNNIVPQFMLVCTHWTCHFLLCKYDRGVLISPLKCLIKLY